MNEAIETLPRARKEIKLTPADEARFWSKVNKDGPTQPHMKTPCWVWAAGKSKRGYGRFRVGGGIIRSHRAAWVLAHGQPPQDLFVCHQCDNPGCCRVEHLFTGTHTDNMRDRAAKGRGNPPRGEAHFSRKHPERLARGDANGSRLHPERLARGEAVVGAKLTATKVTEIRMRYAAGGTSQSQIATQFGVCQTLISQIILHQIWKHNTTPPQ